MTLRDVQEMGAQVKDYPAHLLMMEDEREKRACMPRRYRTHGFYSEDSVQDA